MSQSQTLGPASPLTWPAASAALSAPHATLKMLPQDRLRDLIDYNGLESLETGEQEMAPINREMIERLRSHTGAAGFELLVMNDVEDQIDSVWLNRNEEAVRRHLVQHPVSDLSLPQALVEQALLLAAMLGVHHLSLVGLGAAGITWQWPVQRSYQALAAYVTMHLRRQTVQAAAERAHDPVFDDELEDVPLLAIEPQYWHSERGLERLDLDLAAPLHTDISIGIHSALTVPDHAGHPMPMRAFEAATGAFVTHRVLTAAKVVFPVYTHEQSSGSHDAGDPLPKALSGMLAGAQLIRYTFLRAQEVDPAGCGTLVATMSDADIAMMHRTYGIAACGLRWEMWMLEADEFRQNPARYRASYRASRILEADIRDSQSLHRLFLAMADSLLVETATRRYFLPRLLKLIHPAADPLTAPVVLPDVRGSGSGSSDCSADGRAARISVQDWAAHANGGFQPDAARGP